MTAEAFTMPDWPRYLTREQAAIYLGVGKDTFTDEVTAGFWPHGRARGGRGGKLTWDRKLLDLEADRFANLSPTSHAAEQDGPPDPAIEALDRRIDGQAAQNGHQRRHQAAA